MTKSFAPPLNRAIRNLVKFVLFEENRLEEAIQRRQCIGFPKQSEADVAVQESFLQHNLIDASLYNWRAKFSDLEVSDAKRRKVLETTRRESLRTEAILDADAL